MFLLNIDIERFSDYVPDIVESLHWFAPEFQIAVAAIAILLLDLVVPVRSSRHLAWVAVFALVYAAMSLVSLHEEEAQIFLGMIAIDSYANFFKLFFLLGGIPIVVMSYLAREFEGRRMGEYYAILLASILGAMLMGSSNHLLMAFMSLELLSISSYVLVGFHRRSKLGSEASLKYIIYGSVASAIMGYGLSLLYGLSGSGYIPDIFRELQAQGASVTMVLALIMTFLGLAYKMATIPMHFWSPDVYEGAPTPVTAFLSVASKAAGFALCMRMLGSFSAGSDPDAASNWLVFLVVVAMVTMTLGNLAALWQENMKRLFAYSSIAHAGYMLMGVTLLEIPRAADAAGGIPYVAYYLLAYLAMNLGAFVIIILIENRTGSVQLKDYAGVGWRAPFMGISLTVFLFSLVGIPPTAGFMGKLQIFMGVVRAANMAEVETHLRILLYVMTAVALANTAISVYYYAKIIRNMYLLGGEEEGAERIRAPLLGNLMVITLLLMTFYLFFSASSILQGTLDLKIFTGA